MTQDIETRSREVEFLFMEDEIIEASKCLLQFVEEFDMEGDYKNMVIILCRKFNKIKKERRMDLRDPKELDREENSIINNMLEIMDEIKQNQVLAAA